MYQERGPTAKQIRDCIEICQDSYRTSVETLNYCLEEGGTYADPALIRSLQECSEICRLAIDFLLRDSEFQPQICRDCAEICWRCAQNCEELNDTRLVRCAEISRFCAEACERMASTAIDTY